MKRFPFYLSQVQLDDLAFALYKLQHIVDVATGDAPAPDRPSQLLSDLRLQCCYRSGAEDPFFHLPLQPCLTDPRSRQILAEVEFK